MGSEALPDRWIAPWDANQVDTLNAMQADERFHGYTCPGERECTKHGRMLKATINGWISNCGRYRQQWAHAVPFALAHLDAEPAPQPDPTQDPAHVDR